MNDPELARVPDPPEPPRKPKRINLRLEALEGMAIGVPARIKVLIESAEPVVLQPGPCQSDHSLSSAIDSMGGTDRADQVTQDPSFPSALSEEEWR
jgi:hypothetical protein